MELLNIPRKFFMSWYRAARAPECFEEVKTFALFIGYPRSGHTLVGFLLDAHPRILVASQTSALKYLRYGFGAKQVFHLLALDSQRVATMGRLNRRYSYAVPGQWQGKFDGLRVVGESTGMTRLRHNPPLLRLLRERLAGIDVRLIHVIRNTFDNISTMKMRSGETLPEAIDRYFSMCEIVESMKSYVAAGAVLDVYHESLIENPQETLRSLCAALDLECSEDYLNDCASIIYKASHKSRKEVEWDPALIDRVKTRMEKFPYLKRYSYED